MEFMLVVGGNTDLHRVQNKFHILPNVHISSILDLQLNVYITCINIVKFSNRKGI